MQDVTRDSATVFTACLSPFLTSAVRHGSHFSSLSYPFFPVSFKAVLETFIFVYFHPFNSVVMELRVKILFHQQFCSLRRAES